jgi:hypothetical protein
MGPYKRRGSCLKQGDLKFFPWLSEAYRSSSASPSLSSITKPCCTSRALAVQYKKAGVGVYLLMRAPNLGKIGLSLPCGVLHDCLKSSDVVLHRVLGFVCSAPVFDTSWVLHVVHLFLRHEIP